MPSIDELADAVASDHPCAERSCDITVALDEGFTQIAAWLLESATTEHPALSAWFKSGGMIPRYLDKCADWPDWKEFHDAYGRKCPSCETFNYASEGREPYSCGNCGAAL